MALRCEGSRRHFLTGILAGAAVSALGCRASVSDGDENLGSVTLADEAHNDMHYAIDFVADCGADPTGQSNCAPAMQTAIGKALTKKAAPPYAAAHDFTLHVPPGVYRFTSTIGVANMTGISTFRIEGHRAASIFLIASGDTNQAVFGFANQLSCEIDGITFLGAGIDSTADCAGILDINSTYQTVFSNVQIHALIAAYYGILTEGFGAVSFRNCFSANSSCAAANGGLWISDGARAVSFEECAFVDAGQINGHSPSGGASRLGPHKNTICVRGVVRAVHFRGVLVDEACVTGILIGDGTNPIGTVDATELFVNLPVFQAGDAGLRVRNARSVTLRGFDHGTFCRVPAVKLEGVDRADIRNVRKRSGNTAYMVTADAACKWLRVADPDGFAAADIAADSAIPIKFVDVLGAIVSL